MKRSEPAGDGRPVIRGLANPELGERALMTALLDLETHGGRTLLGVFVRVAQRLLALTTVIWHNQSENEA